LGLICLLGCKIRSFGARQASWAFFLKKNKRFLNGLLSQIRPASNEEVHQTLKRDLFFDSGVMRMRSATLPKKEHHKSSRESTIRESTHVVHTNFLSLQYEPSSSTFRRQIERNDSGAKQEASNLTINLSKAMPLSFTKISYSHFCLASLSLRSA